MQFKLVKKSSNRQISTFHVVDGQDSICGSINVQNQEVPDLLRCWSGSTADSAQPKAKASAKATMVAAFLRNLKRRPVSRAAILRGC
jgi:hypothetical protein